jgi:hypothetical protein
MVECIISIRKWKVKLNGVLGKSASRKINSPVRRTKNAEYMRAEAWDWEGGVVFVAPFFVLQMDAEAARDGLWEIDEDAFA